MKATFFLYVQIAVFSVLPRPIFANDFFANAGTEKDAPSYYWHRLLPALGEPNIPKSPTTENLRSWLASEIRSLELLSASEKEKVWAPQLGDLGIESLKEELKKTDLDVAELKKLVLQMRRTVSDIPIKPLQVLKNRFIQLVVRLELENDLANNAGGLVKAHVWALAQFAYNKERGIVLGKEGAVDYHRATWSFAWLRIAGVYPALSDAFEQRYQVANLKLGLSLSLLQKFKSALQPPPSTTPVNTVTKDGTVVNGQAQVHATADPQFAPSNQGGVMRISAHAVSKADTVSNRKRVTAQSHTHSDINIIQDIRLDGLDINFLPVSIDIDSDIKFNGFTVNWKRPFFNKRNFGAGIVARVAEGKKPEIAAEGNAMMAANIRSQLDKKLVELQTAYEDLKYRFLLKELARGDLELSANSYSTTQNFFIDGRLFEHRALSLADTLPLPMDKYEFTAAVHETAISSMGVLSNGQSLEETTVRDMLFDKLGVVVPDDQVDSESGVIPATLVFSDFDSVKARIFAEGFSVQFFIKSFEEDGEQYQDRSYSVWGLYQISAKNGGLRLERTQPLQVIPLSGEKLGKDLEALKRASQRILPPVLQSQPIRIKDKNKEFGALHLESVQTLSSGWMHAGWRLQMDDVKK